MCETDDRVRSDRGYADAHVCLADPAAGSRRTLRRWLDEQGVGCALVMTGGADSRRDAYGRLCEAAWDDPERVFPLYRHRVVDLSAASGRKFEINQLELLWQRGALAGLTVDLAEEEAPPEYVLDWAERRGVLTLWHVLAEADLERLYLRVVSRRSFPVLVRLGGRPADRAACFRKVVEGLSRFSTLDVLTCAGLEDRDWGAVIERHPERVIAASDGPQADPTAARAAIERLDVSERGKALVLCDNLRRRIDGMRSRRTRALREADELLFPPIPANAEQLAAQQFVVVPADEFAASEFEAAKDFWSGYELKSWYKQHKPWARLLANLAGDLKPRSVLEFGCNVGRNLAAIREAAPAVRLLGIDVNPQAVSVGRERTGLDLRHGDEGTLAEFSQGEFDLVFTVSVLDHISDVARVCRELLRVTGKCAYFLEVRLPVEGKVLQHYDHHRQGVFPSTGASYSWHLEKHFESAPRVESLDWRLCYLHSGSLGPYYAAYSVFLDG
jgi:SAM-dependent methyltransferase